MTNIYCIKKVLLLLLYKHRTKPVLIKTLIINVNNNDEFHCVIDDNSLNTENSYILSIKSYMDNDSILDRIKNESEFKNITLLYKAEEGSNSNVVMDNLYLVSK